MKGPRERRIFLLCLSLGVPLICLKSCYVRESGGTFISLYSEHLLSTYCMLVLGLALDVTVTRYSPGLLVLVVQ